MWQDGFHALTSCRPMFKDWLGPIPWTAMDQYCRTNHINGELREDFFYHVSRLDKSYLDWAKQKAKQTASNLAGAKPAPKRGRR